MSLPNINHPVFTDIISRAKRHFVEKKSIMPEFRELCHNFPRTAGSYQADGCLDDGYAKFFTDIQILVNTDLEPNLSRIDIPHYAMSVAIVASMRSEDPVRKVGAVALDDENRIVATAYNGLTRGQDVEPKWWESDVNRRKYVLHAEANLCSLTQRGQVKSVAVTTIPCGPCALNLVAHGVKTIYFGVDYPTDPTGREILEMHGVQVIQVPIIETNELISRFCSNKI